MRKFIILALMAATVIPGVASAQSTREVRNSQHELRQENRDLRQAQRYGTRADIRHERRDVRDARQDLRRDVRDSRRDARQDRRENWQDYRRTHRDVYRGGNWRAPFRYSNWNAGARIGPAYYASRYDISDPARYRLPRPGANLRWVRHYNDVLLVNVRTGRVVQVNRGFFW